MTTRMTRIDEHESELLSILGAWHTRERLPKHTTRRLTAIVREAIAHPSGKCAKFLRSIDPAPTITEAQKQNH